ncbi:MAG: hypothetical protein ACREJO_10870 [Phycisphaerales bacterium]
MTPTTHHRSSLTTAAFLAIAAALTTAACSPKDGPIATLDPPGQTTLPPGPARVMEQLAPVKIRVHPLTRISIQKDEPPKLNCHFELLDQFNHSIKWLGKVRVELYRPVADAASSPIGATGTEKQELVWNQDLNDPRTNADMYDWVTRTYLLPLGDLPAWAVHVADGTSRDPWLTLKIYFTFVDVSGQDRTLSAQYRINRGQ